MSVTLRDIAEELGISQMTASRALRGVSCTSPETRRRVRDVAMRLGYQPMEGVFSAPAVRTGKGNHTLRLLLPTIGGRPDRAAAPANDASWYLDRILKAMRERLELTHGGLVEQHFQTLDEVAESVSRGRFHGIVLRQPLPHAWIEKLQRLAPVVYAVEFDHQTGVDSVYSNEHRSAGTVLAYLSRRGHERIAWFGILDRHQAPYETVFDALDESDAIDRQVFSVHGARHAAWANIAYCQVVGQRMPLVLVERDWNKQNLEEVVSQGLDRILAIKPKVTAIVCSCDPVATTTLALCRQRGLSVPRDLSIVSYGGSPEVTEAKPAITAVQMPLEMIGRIVPELVERRMADPKAVPISVQFETTLFEGESVGVVRASGPARQNREQRSSRSPA